MIFGYSRIEDIGKINLKRKDKVYIGKMYCNVQNKV